MERDDHQVEEASIEARTLGNVFTRTLVGLVRSISAEERDKLGISDTLDMHERSFYEAWVHERMEHPGLKTAFYEERLSQRLNMPLKEVKGRLRVARKLSTWLHKQF